MWVSRHPLEGPLHEQDHDDKLPSTVVRFREGHWSWVGWMVACVLTVAVFVASYFTTGVVAFVTQGNCYEPATARGLTTARGLLGGQLVLLLVPWLGFAVRWRRVRLAVCGLLATSWAMYAVVLVFSSTRAEWSGFGICF